MASSVAMTGVAFFHVLLICEFVSNVKYHKAWICEFVLILAL